MHKIRDAVQLEPRPVFFAKEYVVQQMKKNRLAQNIILPSALKE